MKDPVSHVRNLTGIDASSVSRLCEECLVICVSLLRRPCWLDIVRFWIFSWIMSLYNGSTFCLTMIAWGHEEVWYVALHQFWLGVLIFDVRFCIKGLIFLKFRIEKNDQHKIYIWIFIFWKKGSGVFVTKQQLHKLFDYRFSNARYGRFVHGWPSRS